MKIIDKEISKNDLKRLARKSFHNLVKAVVDIEKEIMVVDAQLHADEEAFLLQSGSKQENLWGINLYPDLPYDEMIEFDSMINLRPSVGNNSQIVENEKVREKIIKIVQKLVKNG